MFEIFSTCLLHYFPCLFRETCIFVIVVCFSFCLSIAFLCTFFFFAIKAMLRKRTVLKCSDDNTTVVLCLIKRCWLKPEDTFI